jgi:hypothetical protein
VASFALRTGDVLLLVDPLLPENDTADTVPATLDAATGDGPVAILITIPCHARSAEALWGRYRRQGASIHGHANVAKRLHDASGLVPSSTKGALHLWEQRRIDERVQRFHRERLVPTLRPLLDLGARRVLVTHGAPVLADGTRALAGALDAGPGFTGAESRRNGSRGGGD